MERAESLREQYLGIESNTNLSLLLYPEEVVLGIDVYRQGLRVTSRAAPTSWTVIPPEQTLSRNVEVIIANSGGTILVLDFDACQDQVRPISATGSQVSLRR